MKKKNNPKNKVAKVNPFKDEKVVITSAKPLDTDTLAKIKTMYEGKNIEQRLDPTIIGGISIRYMSKMLDGTVQSQLEALRRKLLSN